MSLSKVLVVGGSGLLGRRLMKDLNNEFEVFGTYCSSSPVLKSNYVNLDVKIEGAISSLFKDLKPEIVVNCIGLTSVEVCEREKNLSHTLNSDAPYLLASASRLLRARFIHISTDHFQSSSTNPRSESDLVWPINQYGISKLDGERRVLEAYSNSTIIRTSFFGPGRRNGSSLWDFVVQGLQNGGTINGFQDIRFSPVSISYATIPTA